MTSDTATTESSQPSSVTCVRCGLVQEPQEGGRCRGCTGWAEKPNRIGRHTHLLMAVLWFQMALVQPPGRYTLLLAGLTLLEVVVGLLIASGGPAGRWAAGARALLCLGLALAVVSAGGAAAAAVVILLSCLGGLLLALVENGRWLSSAMTFVPVLVVMVRLTAEHHGF